jgi:hypothetical protein
MPAISRRGFLQGAVAATALGGAEARAEVTPAAQPAASRERMVLAPAPRVVFRSQDPAKDFPRSPGICVLNGRRIVLTMEHSAAGLKKNKAVERDPEGRFLRGRAYVSDDGGENLREVSAHALWMARPFEAGGRLYILGHHEDIGIMASDDRGETWGPVSWLTSGEFHHQAPCNVHYANGRVYLVMERYTSQNRKLWPVYRLAPVVMSAPVDADLTKQEVWRFSNVVPYIDMVKAVEGISGVGLPFFRPGPTVPGDTGKDTRPMAPMGWLETHVVDFPDPNHVWHDPAGRTFYLWARAHTGATNYACVAKVVEDESGAMTVSPALAPSGKPMLYVPCPGGHLKFHLLYDDVSGLYWLVSNQSTDSMTRPDRLPDSRYMLPDNERHRLALHFSRNCVDWCFAGLVDKTEDPKQARSYASMAIAGEDLLVFARSGDEQAVNAHDGNILTLHRVPAFRSLVY